MAEDLIRYDILAQDALRNGIVRKVLSEVAKTGLPGEHHFYVTFATRAPGVRISSRLLNQYPEDMTIVLQHQYWDLTTTEHAFEVGLSFNGVPERILVPFTAIKSFTDPSVPFQLGFEIAPARTSGQLEVVGKGEPSEIAAAEPAPAATAEPAAIEGAAAREPAEASGKPAQVVSLDAFRKKS